MWTYFKLTLLDRLSSLCKMGAIRLYLLISFIVCFVALQLDVSYAEGDGAPTPQHTTTKHTTLAATKAGPNSSTNETQLDGGSDLDSSNPLGDLIYDKGMLRRSFYVLIGFTALAVLFFVFRWVRGKGRRKTKKYGVLATHSSDMELRPLDEEDDEEDMTVFDVNSK